MNGYPGSLASEAFQVLSQRNRAKFPGLLTSFLTQRTHRYQDGNSSFCSELVLSSTLNLRIILISQAQWFQKFLTVDKYEISSTHS